MKHFGDLLKYPLNAPARPIEREQIVGGILLCVQQIGEQNNRLLAGTVARSAAARSGAAWPAHTPTIPTLLPTADRGHPGRTALA